MDRRGTVAVLVLSAVAAAGVVPAFAADGATAKQLKGTWSFIDVTPDATPSAMGEPPVTPARNGKCVGKLPSAPTDVNSHAIKLLSKGTLSVNGNNTLDWAMELRDAKGEFLAGSDGTLPQDKEGMVVSITKPGTYTVVFCNLTGAPTATASYTFQPR